MRGVGRGDKQWCQDLATGDGGQSAGKAQKIVKAPGISV